MRLMKRLTALCLSVLLVLNVSACGNNRDKTAKNLNIESYVTLNVWYSDSNYTDYLNMVADSFHTANEMVTVQLNYVNSDDYLSSIYDESVNHDNVADVYLMSSDDCQKAYLMGLMAENTSYSDVYTEDIYGAAGINACSYKGKLYGYPISFNTSFLVYNQKYASSVSTFAELTDYCNNYEVTEDNQDVQMLVSWDVSDMFLNFPFISSYISLTTVDDSDSSSESIEVAYSTNGIKSALSSFYQLKDTYGIDRSTVSIDSTLEAFTEGRLVYTILDADHLNALNESGVEYGIAEIPALNSDLISKAVSETTMAVVNPYTDNQTVAEAFAKAVSYDYADLLSDYSSLQCARGNVKYTTNKEQYAALYNIYQNSIPKSGIIASYEFYMRYEIMIHQIWDGKSVDDAYATFEEYLSNLDE